MTFAVIYINLPGPVLKFKSENSLKWLIPRKTLTGARLRNPSIQQQFLDRLLVSIESDTLREESL